MENLEKKTTELNRLINANNSGKSAWKAGEMLFEIKNNNEFRLENFNSFGEYTQKKLKINETKAYNYINIYKLFPNDSLDEGIMVTHLITLAKENQNVREALLDGIRKKKKKLNEGREIIGRNEITTDVIAESLVLIKSAQENNISLIPSLVDSAIDLAVENKYESIKSFKLPNKHGKLYTSKFFEHVNIVFPYEPTCEMDVVGLFSAIFYYLRDIPFKYSEQKQLVTFDHIVYLRAAFPDAQVKLVNKQQNYNHTIDVEFEFLSRSYETHLKSNKSCHLIVCWENNINVEKYDEFKLKIPPILSLKKVINTGKIELE